MTRIAAGLVLFAGTALAAPVPKDAGKTPLYFPTAVGAKWVYEDARGEDEEVEVYEVKKDGDNMVVGRRRVGEPDLAPYTKMVVSPDGLRQDRPNAEGEDVEVWVLKTKLKAGESWKVADGGKRTVHGPEEIKVAAGKYQALKVVWETETETQTSWYAPGVGEVKRVIKRGDQEIVRRSLKSFTEGKK